MKPLRFGLLSILFIVNSFVSFSIIDGDPPVYPKNQSKDEYVLSESDDDIRYFDELVVKRSDSIESVGLLIYSKCKEKFKKTNSNMDKSRLAFIANRLGDYYSRENVNQVDNAIKYFKISLKLKKELNEKGRPYIYAKLGSIAYNNGKYAITIQASLKALELSAQIENNTREELVVVLFAQNRLGETYKLINDFESARKYFEGAVLTSKKSYSKYGEAISLYNLGKMVGKLEGSSSSLPYFKESFRLYTSEREKIVTTHSGQITRVAIQVSRAYLELHQLDSANFYAEKAIQYSSVLDEKISKMDVSILQAELAFEEKNYRLAEQFGIAALNYFDHQSSKSNKKLYEILVKIYEKQNNLSQALKYSRLFEAARDSTLNLERQKELIAMNTKIELKKLDKKNQRALDQKQAELAKVKEDSELNRRRLYVWSAVLATCLICFFWLWNKRHKRKIAAKQAEAEEQIKIHLEKILLLESKANQEQYELVGLDAERINRNMEKVLHTKLTGREIDVLLELSKGKNNSEIGEALFISVNTVRTHLLKIYDKMEVKSRIQAVKKAEDLSRTHV